MRNRTAMLLLVLSLCPAPVAVARAEAVASPDTSWMTVLLGGRKIGHLEIQHERTGDVVTTTQDLVIELNRSGSGIPLGVLTRSVESSTGEPLGFYARSTLSSTDTIVEGKRQPSGDFAVTTTVDGNPRQTLLVWPPGAMLSEGQRLALIKAAGKPGENYTMDMFDPASQAVARVAMTVIGNEKVALPEGTMILSHQRQVLKTPRGSQTMDLWLDDQGYARKGMLDMLGRKLEMLACSRKCAMAPVQKMDMFRAAMVDSPRLLPAYLRTSFLRYRIRAPSGGPQPIIGTDEQHVLNLGRGNWLAAGLGIAHCMGAIGCTGNPRPRQARGGRRAGRPAEDAPPAQLRQRLHHPARAGRGLRLGAGGAAYP